MARVNTDSLIYDDPMRWVLSPQVPGEETEAS